MKTLMFVVSALCLSVAVAADAPAPTNTIAATTSGTNATRKLSGAEFKSAVYRSTGGFVKIPNIQKGRIVYVNCQKSANVEWLKFSADYFAKKLKIEVAIDEGTFDLKNPVVHGELSLFVVDDPALPMTLAAPEARWAMVNVAQLKSEKPQFFEARVKKQLTRGFCYLCGAVGSQYPSALTEYVGKAADLDTYIDAALPVDILSRMLPYLKMVGIIPYREVTYRKACIEGWAPAPKDEVQQKIWNKVRQLPSDPIKIKFDPKKDAGK